MRNRESNLVNMIRATLLYCNNNVAATAIILAFAGVKTSADNKLVLIDSLNQVAGGTTTGVTLDTKTLKETMIQIAYKCANAVSAYATSVNNNTLKAKVNYTLSELRAKKKEDIDDICQTIHDEANTNIALAGPFGYLATDVTDLNTAISLFRTASQNPRQAIITKKQANENIISIIRDVIDNLFAEQMDKMVKTLTTVNPNFVKGYFFAREIINLGSTSAKVRGTIKNEEEVPLVGAKFYLTITGQSQKVDETTSLVGGKFGIANLLPNDYDLYWEHPFYQPKTETNVHISAGKEIRRNVTLLHLPPFTGTINSGQQANILNNAQPFWTPGVTIKIKNTTTGSNTTSIAFYTANSAAESYSGSNGSVLTNGQEETHTLTAAEFKAFLNIQNQGPYNGTYEITIL